MNTDNKVIAYIHETAVIAPGARIAKNVEIGPYSVIGENVEIGEGTKIGPHVVIHGWTQIARTAASSREPLSVRNRRTLNSRARRAIRSSVIARRSVKVRRFTVRRAKVRKRVSAVTAC